MSSTDPEQELVERVARAIAPDAFRRWQSMFDYCKRQRDTDDEARRIADSSEGPAVEVANEQARAAIAALRPALSKEQIEARERVRRVVAGGSPIVNGADAHRADLRILLALTPEGE